MEKDFHSEASAVPDGQAFEESLKKASGGAPAGIGQGSSAQPGAGADGAAQGQETERGRGRGRGGEGFKVRQGQREFERGVEEHRVCGLLARRQYGKTTIASRIALKKMMRVAGHTVVFGSVKLDLGREIVRKEAEAMQRAFALMSRAADKGGGLLQVVDAGKSTKTNKAQQFSADDWAEIYEACRLEFRLWHSRTVFSRTKVVALNAAAVGETGDLILDEVGRVKQFREVVEAVMPIIASNPEFRCIYTTTPPPDDTHYSFDLLAPPIGVDLPVNGKGNWYRSELGVWVLRITAWDAAADGVPLYDDDTGRALSPEESRAVAHDKDAWDRNYGCKFVMGGTAACGLQQLDVAQRRGIEQCHFFQINSDGEFDEAVKWVQQALGPGRVGLGWDVATTTKETSNPSALVVVEESGSDVIVRGILAWKTADPDVAIERALRVVQAVRGRKEGGRARRLCLDATNERYFAQRVRTELGHEVGVELVVMSETIELAGEPAPITMKQYLGGMLIGELDDNHLALPPERYVREDWRLVRKEKGQFVCEPDGSGRHGDTFDGTKLALRALKGASGTISSLEDVAGIRMGGQGGRFGARSGFRPRSLVGRG